LSYDPHSRSSASLEALELRKQALILERVCSSDDPLLTAMAIAQQSTAPKIYRVIAAGYGSVRSYIEGHWFKMAAVEITEMAEPENRRPAGWDPFRK
jgi:hypothetical protein